MIEWYLKVVRDNYANFNGRARRAEYWYFVLFSIIIGIIFTILEAIVPAIIYVNFLYSLAVLLPSIAVAVRRMHDVGKSGWYILIPIYNIVLLATEGDHGPNEYGPDPKNPYNEMDDIGQPDKY